MYGIRGKSFKTLFLEEIGSKLNGSQPLCIAAVHLCEVYSDFMPGWELHKKYILLLRGNIISYPLFADADTGIYPHAASQYHARPKAKRGIAMLSVDKFPYPRKQTRGNEFIPCSDNICDILKRFRSFKIPAITLIWPKSSYKHSITRSYRSGKESGRRSESPLWRHQWRSFVFISHADDVKREIRLHISRLLTNQKRESARSMG